VRTALRSEDLSVKDRSVKERAIRIVAWQGDRESLPMLKKIHSFEAAWAVEKIESLYLGAP
jgi:hypothetical protein